VSEAQLDPRRVGAAYNSVDPDEIDLAEYLSVIWRHRWMIAVLCLVSMMLTMAWTLAKPRQYASTTIIIPPVELLQDQVGGGIGGLGAIGKSMLRSVMDTGSTADIYAEILKSREVGDALVDRFNLVTTYKRVRFRSDALTWLRKNTKIETTDQGAVKITVTDLDPNRACAITRAYVQELDKQNKRLSTGRATSKKVFLGNRLKEVEAKLGQIDSILSREAKIQEMLYEMLVQEYELAKIEEAKSMPTIQVLDEAVVPELPISRGVAKKGVMAAVVAFMLGVFVAFAYEYALDVRRRHRARVATGQYDVYLPDDGSAPVEAHGGSKEIVSADKATAPIGTEAGHRVPAGLAEQPPKRR
jgi:uncharacterized protein involved in exopolysaccharide biosynthesis